MPNDSFDQQLFDTVIDQSPTPYSVPMEKRVAWSKGYLQGVDDACRLAASRQPSVVVRPQLNEGVTLPYVDPAQVRPDVYDAMVVAANAVAARLDNPPPPAPTSPLTCPDCGARCWEDSAPSQPTAEMSDAQKWHHGLDEETLKWSAQPTAAEAAISEARKWNEVYETSAKEWGWSFHDMARPHRLVGAFHRGLVEAIRQGLVSPRIDPDDPEQVRRVTKCLPHGTNYSSQRVARNILAALKGGGA